MFEDLGNVEKEEETKVQKPQNINETTLKYWNTLNRKLKDTGQRANVGSWYKILLSLLNKQLILEVKKKKNQGIKKTHSN